VVSCFLPTLHCLGSYYSASQILIHRQDLVQLRAASGPFLSDTESSLINHVEACVRRRATAKRSQAQSAQSAQSARKTPSGSRAPELARSTSTAMVTSQDDEGSSTVKPDMLLP